MQKISDHVASTKQCSLLLIYPYLFGSLKTISAMPTRRFNFRMICNYLTRFTKVAGYYFRSRHLLGYEAGQ